MAHRSWNPRVHYSWLLKHFIWLHGCFLMNSYAQLCRIQLLRVQRTKLLHGHSFPKVVALIQEITLYTFLQFWRLKSQKLPNTRACSRLYSAILFPLCGIMSSDRQKLHDKSTLQFLHILLKAMISVYRIMPSIQCLQKFTTHFLSLII